MNRQILLLCLFLFLQLFCKETSAQKTYYVDITKPTNGDGSFSNPWNNILSGIYGSAPSDTSDAILYFRQGTYHINHDTTLYLGSDKSGLNGHYFILKAYPGE